MIRLALELPTSKLEQWSPLLDLDFVLAHKVLQDEKYAKFFHDRDATREVLLDNSTHEFGRPMEMQELERAAKMVIADTLIAPDIVTETTPHEQFTQNLEWLRDCHNSFGHICSIGGVVCGDTMQELLDYWRLASTLAEMDMWLFTFHKKNRLQWFESIMTWDVHEQIDRIHILGMDTLEELKRWVDMSEGFCEIDFSFDTSKPLKFGVQEIRLDTIDDYRGGKIRSKEVLDLEHFTPAQEQCCEENILWLKKICRGGF